MGSLRQQILLETGGNAASFRVSSPFKRLPDNLRLAVTVEGVTAWRCPVVCPVCARVEGVAVCEWLDPDLARIEAGEKRFRGSAQPQHLTI